jgi:hypothetical protein
LEAKKLLLRSLNKQIFFMAHETHHPAENKSKVSSASAFWYAVILVGLFIAAVNFVNVMGGGEEEHSKPAPMTEEATPSQTLEGETGTGKAMPASDTTQFINSDESGKTSAPEQQH